MGEPVHRRLRDAIRSSPRRSRKACRTAARPERRIEVGLTFTSTNKRWVFIAADAWFNYGNALAPENTNEWTLDGQYHFSAVTKGPYRGLLLRYRYAQRSLSNTFCGAADTTCPDGTSIGSTEFGGLPLFKYNRAQLEYDF